jgi:hypothetical protein
MRSKVRRHIGLLLQTSVAQRSLLSAGLTRAKAGAAEQATSASVPEELTAHQYAIFLLHIAAGIEHALMVEYLYAAFSLGGGQVPVTRRTEVSQWREVILGIAKEEMGHLMTVQNLLRCLGGPLNLDREDFPSDSDFYPFPFKLEPLTRKSLAKYVVTESPEDWSGPEADEIKALAQQGLSGTSSIHRVGALYNTIEALFADEAAAGRSEIEASIQGQIPSSEKH